MRYCRNCRRWNTGDPPRCRYCSAGLLGRLCPSGHVNPPDRHLAYCGECGKPLEPKWGAGFSFKPYLLGLVIAVNTILISAAVWYVGRIYDRLVTSVLILIILVIGFRMAFRILPPWVGKIVGDVLDLAVQCLLGVFNFLLRIVLGTGFKGKK